MGDNDLIAPSNNVLLPLSTHHVLDSDNQSLHTVHVEEDFDLESGNIVSNRLLANERTQQ